MSPLFDQDQDQDDDGYFEMRPERRTLPKVGIALAFLLTALAVVGFGVKGWYGNQVDPSGEPGAEVAVEVPKGTTITGLGTMLADDGVISNANVFRFWVRSKDVEVQAGDYTFRENSSFDEALAVVRKGPAPPKLTRITVPEGLTLRQMATTLSEADARFGVDALNAAFVDPTVISSLRPADQPSMEGLLFPSTYELSEDDDARSLVQRMAQQMEAVTSQVGIANGVQGGAQSVPALSPYQILIVASLIEEETGNPGESSKIARVIYNRLEQDIALGIDATSKYLAEQTGQDIDFESDSPYNTRRQRGLPPTPIAAPGQASIEAALNPAEGPWIYYVLEAPGQHFFTDSESEFLQKKDECEQKGLGCG